MEALDTVIQQFSVWQILDVHEKDGNSWGKYAPAWAKISICSMIQPKFQIAMTIDVKLCQIQVVLDVSIAFGC